MMTQQIKIASHLSDKYKPVDSNEVLKLFIERGWYLHKHIGSGLGKQLDVLRNDNYLYSNGDFLTVTLLNSYDGSTRLSLYGGYGRLVCSNGLVIGEVEGIRCKHVGNIYEKLDNSYEKIVAHLESIKSNITFLQTRNITKEATIDVVKRVASTLFESEGTKYKRELPKGIQDNIIASIMQPRREADTGKDAFTVLNVIQENIVRFGRLKALVKITDKEKDTFTYQVKRITPSEKRVESLNINMLISNTMLEVLSA